VAQQYLGLSRALLLIVLFIGGGPLASALRGSLVPFSLILIVFVFTIPWVGLSVLQTVDARESYTPSRSRPGACEHSLSNAASLTPPYS
jgi:hypothetical protein